MDDDLEQLLRQAEEADDLHRIDFRDPIARYKDDGIVGVRPWLADGRMGAFAVRVILKAHELGATTAVAVLRKSLPKAATPKVEEDILWALGRIAPPKHRSRRRSEGERPPSPIARRLDDLSWPRRYMHAWTLWHLVIDEVRSSAGRRRFLSACHHWNSEGFVDTGSRRLQPKPPEGEYCFLCEQAEGRTDRSSSGSWHSVLAPWDGEEQLHIRRDETWHLVEDRESFQAPGMGTVYMTECGWWVEAERMRPDGHGGARSRVCKQCIRFRNSADQEEI